jgi:hypothetical protein
MRASPTLSLLALAGAFVHRITANTVVAGGFSGRSAEPFTRGAIQRGWWRRMYSEYVAALEAAAPAEQVADDRRPGAGPAGR